MAKPFPSRLLAALTAFAVSLVLAALPPRADASTVLSFGPSDDATVRESRPDRNYGAEPELEVDAESRKDALLRFDVSGVGSGTVANVTLRLFVVNSSPVGGDVAEVADTGWDEGTVTWNDAPAGGVVLGSLGSVSAGSWHEVDVTGLVTGDGPVSVRISSTHRNGADYASKEHTNGNLPELVVTLGTPPVPDDVAPSDPTNLEATDVLASQVRLSWDASTDNVGVTGYEVQRDGTPLTTVGGSTTTYVDTTVSGGNDYSYEVLARDAAANWSGPSDPVQVSTPVATASTYDVTRSGSTYRAVEQAGPNDFSGSLKSVVERAMEELQNDGGGRIVFAAGDFDLGSDHFEIIDITDVEFIGQGMGVTTIRNSTNASADTEPFDATRSDRLTVRDMTVVAGGSDRSTSDALDFDGGDDILIERVEITDSRGRGILLDGKDAVSSTGGTALRNVVRDCVITGTPRDGIQLLASSENRIEGCQITGVGGEGIRAHRSSSSAAQPNKPSNDNVIIGNTVIDAGGNGISVASGHRNRIIDNTVMDSGRDGIRIYNATSSLNCDDNRVELNVANGNDYGLDIEDSECRRTVVGDNDFTGNRDGDIRDNGTGTIYTSSDTQAPSPPANLAATDVQSGHVDLAWDAATDNEGVTSYRVFRDGSFLAGVGGGTLTYRDDSVSGNTTYQYHVVARDAAGNTSGPSNTVDVTTLTAPPPPPPPPTQTFTPTDDATLRESNPTSNYGARDTVEVDAQSRKDALIQFDVTGVGTSSVTKVTLRLYCVDSSSVGGDVSAAGSGWSQDDVTWDSAPGAGTPLGSLGGVSAGNWYEVDVTGLVTEDGRVSVRISSTNPNGADYASSEHANGNAPELVVETAP